MDDLKVRITLSKWSMTRQGLTRSCRKLLPYRELSIRKTRSITMCIP